jgi:hypothetical protein
MAKKKKSKKTKLPKSIAGVKIPKSLRNGALGDFAQSRAGKIIIAEVVMALGALLAGHEAKRGSATRQALSETGEAVKAASEKAGDVGAGAAATGVLGDRLAHAFAEAGAAFRRALHDEPEAPVLEAPPTPPKKPKTAGAPVGEPSKLAH